MSAHCRYAGQLHTLNDLFCWAMKLATRFEASTALPLRDLGSGKPAQQLRGSSEVLPTSEA